MDSDHFREVIERLRADDPSAANELVAEYEQEIRRYVRFRLRTFRMKRLIESVDISQSVFARFFADLRRDFVCPESPDQLRALLVTMAKNKLIDQNRYNSAGKRDLALVDPDGSVALQNKQSSAPSPASVIADQELLAALRSNIAESDLDLIDSRLGGSSWGELAERFDSTPEALRKKFRRLIDSAAKQLDGAQ